VDATTRVSAGLCEVEDPRMYGKLHARDPGGPTNARHEVVSGPVGEGDEPQVQYERYFGSIPRSSLIYQLQKAFGDFSHENFTAIFGTPNDVIFAAVHDMVI